MASKAQGVTSFAVVPLPAFQKPERCVAPRGTPGVAVTGGGIGIGAPVQEVQTRLGGGALRGSRLEIIHVAKAPPSVAPGGGSPQEWDVTTSLVGTVKDGRLVEFEVARIISN